jgi:hypothetical protein
VLDAMPDPGSLELLGVLVLLPVIGLGIGAGQGFALRRYLSGSLWWILATGLGWLLGLSVDFTFQQMVGSSAWQGFALAGLYQAVLQWLLLRRRGWVTLAWLPVCAAAWVAAGIAYHLLSAPISRIAGAEWAVAVVSATTWAAAALVFALPTAPLILRLVRKKGSRFSGG